MDDPDHQPLKAAGFSPRVETPSEPETTPSKRPPWLLPGISILAVAAVLVFFVLPGMMDSGESVVVENSGTDSQAPSTAGGSGGSAATEGTETERSPFAEAQQQKLRKAAQDALQVVLEAQEELLAFGVETWAPEAYATAIAIAETGDEAYRQRQFTEAALAYQEAAAALAELQDSIDSRTETARSATRAAIEAGESATARAQQALLELLAPGDPELPIIEQRIAAIPAVGSALEAARAAAAGGDTAAAVAAAEEALKADPQHQGAAEALAGYREADINARFRRAMSEGYVQMESEQFADAASAFQRAARIRPGAPEPQAALVELAAAETAWQLRQLARQGETQEQQEAWGDAVATYEQALAVDNTLIFARDGLARATPRAELAKALEGVLKEPERLVDTRALQAADNLLKEARGTVPGGPKLEQQITELEALLTWAKTPVSVQLTSDALTDVTLLRVKRLGSFDTTRLTLRPGRYTALGVRNGFRDVRINFDIKPDSQPVIDVHCQEAI